MQREIVIEEKLNFSESHSVIYSYLFQSFQGILKRYKSFLPE